MKNKSSGSMTFIALGVAIFMLALWYLSRESFAEKTGGEWVYYYTKDKRGKCVLNKIKGAYSYMLYKIHDPSCGKLPRPPAPKRR